MTSPVAATIGPAGIIAPTFPQILTYLTGVYQSIYGADVYLGNDSQDGQFIAAISQAIADCNAGAVAAYNAFSPATAQGAGLSSVVKINGLRRFVPSPSTAVLTIVGVAGTIITNGQAIDTNLNLWNLSTTVIIPLSGTITVTAQADVAGATAAPASTITGIRTPVYGWQSVTNASPATLGQPVESDAALRVRQSNSVELPSVTIFDGIWSLIQTVTGVTRVRGYENNTASTDANGIPANNLAFVVEGGAAAAIEAAIAAKIPPGISTYGTTTATLTDAYGSTRVIKYSVSIPAVMHVAMTIKRLTGWDDSIETTINAYITAYLNSLPIGTNVSYTAMFVAAYAALAQFPGTYGISALTMNKNALGLAAADTTIAYNEVPTSIAANIVYTLT